MATNRTVYHVVPDSSGDRWVISQENDDRFREEHRTKEDAVQAAKSRARQQEPSEALPVFHFLRVALAASLSFGCDRGDTTPEQSVTDREPGDAAPAANRAGELRVADIVGDPERYFGQTVTLRGEAQEVHSPMAFTLDEDAPLRGGIDNELLVFSRKADNLEPIEDDWTNNGVRVTGTVGRMTVIEVEREVGWDLNPELEAEVEGSRVIFIASSVQRVGDSRPRQ